MASVKFHKVSSLPSTPEPNALYFVNTGLSVDIYVTDDTGAAFPAGGGASIGGAERVFIATKTNGNQTTSTDPTKITFNSELFDPDNVYDVANSRYTPGVAGRVVIGANIKCANASQTAGYGYIQIRKNGVSIFEHYEQGNIVNPSFSETILDTCTATDYYEIFVRSQSGSPTVTAGNVQNNNARFFGYVISEGGGGGGTAATNLTAVLSTTDVVVESDTGNDATIPAATALLAGVMAAADKSKLDGIEAGATADLSGSEIVSLINAAFGSTDWQGPNGAMSSSRNVTVRVATASSISNITSALAIGATLNGVVLASGDLVLVKDHTAPESNGIFVVGASPARAPLFDTFDAHAGLLVVVQEGAVGADTAWLCTSDEGGTLGTTPITFVSAAIAPTNITVSRDTTTVTINSSTGSGGSIGSASATDAGVMTAADKSKLDSIAAGAQVNVPTDLTISQTGTDATILSSTGSDVVVPGASGTLAGLLSAADKVKLDGLSPTTTIIPPQGRLTCAFNNPVPLNNTNNQAFLYYEPFNGSLVPVYNGSSTPMVDIGTRLTLELTNNVGVSQYHQGQRNFDVFYANVGGTLYFGTGPQWTSDTVRSTGLIRRNGIFVNNTSFILRYGVLAGDTVTVPAQQATYLGTIRTTIDGRIATNLTGSGAGGVALVGQYVWNAYNRVRMAFSVRDTVGIFTHTVADTWQRFNASDNNRINFIKGLQEDAEYARFNCFAQTANVSGRGCLAGVGLDSITAITGTSNSLITATAVNQQGQVHGEFSQNVGQGFHYAHALVRSHAGVGSFGGNGVSAGVFESALHLDIFC